MAKKTAAAATVTAVTETKSCNSIPHVVKTIQDFFKDLPKDRHFVIEAFSTNADEYQVNCSSHSLKKQTPKT